MGIETSQGTLRHSRLRAIGEHLANPAMVLFISANFVNLGNLAFNIAFSRWMGPELFGDLTLLLTVKLSLLSILNAVQFELAGRVARLECKSTRILTGQYVNRINITLLAVVFALVLIGASAWFFLKGSSPTTAMHHEKAWLLFALALPFMMPLSLARGYSQGTLDLSKMVWSAQGEMLVRLGGSALAWHLGAGMPGIALAIVLSIAIGWYAAKPDNAKEPLPTNAQTMDAAPNAAMVKPWHLVLAALPWASLQLGQVLSLDGDFLIAKAMLSAEESGIAAVTALVQRILFFGCFGLAMALLPAAAGIDNRAGMLKSVIPVALLFFAVSIPSVIILWVFPEQFVTTVFGENFLPAAPALVLAAISGSSFVCIYLISTFMLARSFKHIGYMVLLLSLIQLGVLGAIALLVPATNVMLLVSTKALLQLVFACLMIRIIFNEFNKFQKV